MEDVSCFLSLLYSVLFLFPNFFTFFYLFTNFPSFFSSSFALVPVSLSFYLLFSSCLFLFLRHDPHNCTFSTTLSREFSEFYLKGIRRTIYTTSLLLTVCVRNTTAGPRSSNSCVYYSRQAWQAATRHNGTRTC